MGDAALIPTFSSGDALLRSLYDVVDDSGGAQIGNASPGSYTIAGVDVTDRRWWASNKIILLTCEGRFGERAFLEQTALPQLNVEARIGARYSKKLPAITLESTTLLGASGRLGSRFSELKVEIRTSHGVAEVKFPEILSEAVATTPVLCDLSRPLPWISSTGSLSGGVGSCDEVLCVLEMTASILTTNFGNLDSSLPGLKGRVTILSGSTGTMSSVLPELKTEANSYSVVISLSAYLPNITPGVASGLTNGLVDNTMTNEDRFDNTLLRYKRWA